MVRVWTLVQLVVLMVAVPLGLVAWFCLVAPSAGVIGACVLGGLLGSVVVKRYSSRHCCCLC